jgi:hypothetical protein
MTDSQASFLALEPCPTESGWSIYRIPIAEFPASSESGQVLRRFYLALDSQLEPRYPHQSAFMQYNQLNLGGAGFRLAEHGKDWMLSWGLGYEPHKPPPTLWTREDFFNLDIAETPRPMMHQLFQITTGDVQIVRAVNELGGIGPLLLTRGPVPTADVLRQGKARFQPLIQDMSLKHFAWYLPLFNLAAFQAANADTMNKWACGLTFYLRENPEDAGVIVASSDPLGPIFSDVGATQEKHGGWTWKPGAREDVKEDS